MTEDRSTATNTDPIKKKRRDRFRNFSAIVKLCLLLLIVLAVLTFWRHRSNISRLMNGTESRFERKKPAGK